MAKKPTKQQQDFVRRVHKQWAAAPREAPREFRMDGATKDYPRGSVQSFTLGDTYTSLSKKKQLAKVYTHLNNNPAVRAKYGPGFDSPEFRTQRAPHTFQSEFPTIHAAGGKLKSAGSYAGGKAKDAGSYVGGKAKQARMVPVGHIEDAGFRRWTEGHTDSVKNAVRLMEQRGKLGPLSAREALKSDLETLKAWPATSEEFGTSVKKYKDPKQLHTHVLSPISTFRKEVARMPKELRNSNTVKAWSSAADRDYNRAERKGGVSEMRAGMSAAERKVGYFRLGQWGGTKRGDIADAAVAEAKMVEQEAGAGKTEAKARGGRKKAEAEEKEASIRMDRALSEERYEGAKAKELAMISEAKIGKRFLGFGPRYGGTIKTQRKTIAKSAEADQLQVEARRVEAQRQIEEAQRGRAMLRGEAAMAGTTEEVSLRRRQLAGTRAVAEAFEEAGHVETGKGRIAREEIDRFIEEMREGATPSDARYARLEKALKVARAEGQAPAFLMEAEGAVKPTLSADTQARRYMKRKGA